MATISCSVWKVYWSQSVRLPVTMSTYRSLALWPMEKGLYIPRKMPKKEGPKTKVETRFNQCDMNFSK